MVSNQIGLILLLIYVMKTLDFFFSNFSKVNYIIKDNMKFSSDFGSFRKDVYPVS